MYELDGIAKKMPRVFFCFSVSALALMGLPGLCGFVSKWYLAKAAFDNATPMAVLGVGILRVSALLTAIYMLSMLVRAYIPEADFDDSKIGEVKDPDWRMLLPLLLFVIGMVIMGLYSGPFVEFFSKVAQGLL